MKYIKKYGYYVGVVLVTLGVLVGLSNLSPAAAESCSTVGRCTSHTTSYVAAKTVVVKEKEIIPIAVPVVVPATVFQYLPALTPVVPVAQVVAPVAAPQVQAQAQPQVSMSAADIEKMVKERVEAALREYQVSKASAVADDNSPPSLTFDDEPVAKSNPGKDNNWVLAMKNSCSRCHQQGISTRGDVVLFDKNGNYAPNVSDRVIAESIRSGAMPKGQTLSATTRQSLLSGFQ